uniref:Nucleolar pre-ribosomal-associated protein 1 n=1 Tax=Mesocestoides corti TaxID=53468 RepID=A0A5K3FH55_MESCO
MENAFTDDLRRELASDCLLACPALLPAYLAHWAPSMVPRDSDNWHDLMGFVNQLFTLFQKRLVSRASQLLELSQDMGQFVQGISDVCLPPACIVEPLRVASQHESSAVVKTSAAIHKTLRKNLSLLLTWLSTTDELKAKGATAEAVVSAILKLLPERVLAEKWFHRFSKTLKKEHTDVQVLNDQVLMHAEADDEPEEQPEESDKRDEPPSPEEELAALPKKFQSRLKTLLMLSLDPAAKITEKEEKKLVKMWPELAPGCLQNYWQKATVYDCIAAGVRLFSRADAKVGWGRTEKSHKDGSLSPSPKKLIKLISKNPVFRSILFEKVLGRPAEELSSLSLSRTKAGLVNLLLALVEAEPIVAAKKIPLVALLAAYRGSLSLCDRLLLQLIYLLDINGTTVSSIWGMSSKAVVWGDRLFDHYRFATTLSEIPTLWREPNPGAFLSMLDKDRVLRTAVAFPVTRRCLARSSMGVENIPLDADLYDPCFLLPLFLQYLSPGKAAATVYISTLPTSLN